MKERTKELGIVQHLNNIGSFSNMSQRLTKKSSQGGTLLCKSSNTRNEPFTNCEHLAKRIEPANDGINLNNDQGSMVATQIEIPQHQLKRTTTMPMQFKGFIVGNVWEPTTFLEVVAYKGW
jgi:hypothetical protein